MKKKLLILFVGIVLFVIAGFTFYSSQSIFDGSRLDNPDVYKLDFERMNMSDTKEMVLNEGDTLVVDYSITKGSVDLIIVLGNEDTIYKGNKIDEGNFELPIAKSGTYTITVEANNAKGHVYITRK